MSVCEHTCLRGLIMVDYQKHKTNRKLTTLFVSLPKHMDTEKQNGNIKGRTNVKVDDKQMFVM